MSVRYSITVAVRTPQSAARWAITTKSENYMYTREPKVGDTATLLQPYLGSRRIELIEKYWYKWRVCICEGGKEIEVYEDEFEIDE